MKHAAESPRRITGTEMEWGGMVSEDVNAYRLRQIEDKELHQSILYYLGDQDMAFVGSEVGCFLQNGARFYADIGQLREYATPEDSSYLGTVANEIAGERILEEIADVHREITGQQILYTKRVIDDQLITRGYHVSYCADRSFVNPEMPYITDPSRLALMGVHAATRSTLFGAGTLLTDGSYAIAQKAIGLTRSFDAGTTSGTKPLVNLRNEPLASTEQFTRIHDTSSDPTMSPWATRVKLGSTSIILRMIEAGHELRRLRFQSEPFLVAKDIARDASLNERFLMRNGRGMTALEIQAKLARTARKLYEAGEISLNEEELWTLDEWDRCISDLNQDPRLTVDRVEWVARREVLNRMHKKHGWSWESQLMRYKDRQFSDIAKNGIARALRENAWAKYMPDEELIQDRMYNPPAYTRAATRGNYIRLVGNLANNTQYVDWHHIRHGSREYHLDDPYQASHEMLSKLLAS